MKITEKQFKDIIEEEIKKALLTEAKISFYDLIKKGKKGDEFDFYFRKDICSKLKHRLAGPLIPAKCTDSGAGFAFKKHVEKAAAYHGKIIDDNKIEIETEGTLWGRTKRKKLKLDLVKAIKTQEQWLGKPKGFIYLDKSQIIVGDQSASVEDAMASGGTGFGRDDPKTKPETKPAVKVDPKKETPPPSDKPAEVKPVEPVAPVATKVDPNKVTLKDIEFLKNFDNAKCDADEQNCTQKKRLAIYKRNLTTYNRMKAEIEARDKAAAAKAKAKSSLTPAAPTGDDQRLFGLGALGGDKFADAVRRAKYAASPRAATAVAPTAAATPPTAAAAALDQKQIAALLAKDIEVVKRFPPESQGRGVGRVDLDQKCRYANVDSTRTGQICKQDMVCIKRHDGKPVTYWSPTGRCKKPIAPTE